VRSAALRPRAGVCSSSEWVCSVQQPLAAGRDRGSGQCQQRLGLAGGRLGTERLQGAPRRIGSRTGAVLP